MRCLMPVARQTSSILSAMSASIRRGRIFTSSGSPSREGLARADVDASLLGLAVFQTNPLGTLGSVRWTRTGTLRTPTALIAGRCESANLSQRVAIKPRHSQCERCSGTVRIAESVPVAHPESVRKRLPMRSHFSLVANKGRGSVNRSPQGAIRGGFAVSPQNSGRFARCACCGAALARARRERRASAMNAAWDSPVGREKPRGVYNNGAGDALMVPRGDEQQAAKGGPP